MKYTNIAVFTTSFFEKIMEIYLITTSYSAKIYFIITSYMKYGWLWWRIVDTGIIWLTPLRRVPPWELCALRHWDSRSIKWLCTLSGGFISVGWQAIATGPGRSPIFPGRLMIQFISLCRYLIIFFVTLTVKNMN